MFNQAKQKVTETRSQVLKESITLINGALALVAALAWNEAIKSLIETYFPAGSGLYSRFVYAIFLTLVVVIVSGKLAQFSNKLENNENK